MRSFSLTLAVFASSVLISPVAAATFGTVVAPAGGAAYSDIVLDESRSRLYLVASAVNRVDVYNLKTKAFLTPIALSSIQPVSAALSPDSKYLYVTAYTSAELDVVDLSSNLVTSRVALPTNPEGVAVGADGRVLITAVATGTSTTNTLLLYDAPTVQAGGGSINALTAVPVVPPAASSPVIPAPPGRVYNSYRSHLERSRDGKYIIGVNSTTTNRVVFVYETASGTVLRSRTVTNLSTVLAVGPDGGKFMAGPVLFDSSTLQVMAQENTANAPFAFPVTTAAGGTFNQQINQGGAVFSPDGTVLYSAFNVAPIGAARPSITELLVNDPDNLLINLGIEMPENLAGKMVIDSAGANVYAISDSGFTILPVGTIAQSPLAQPSAQSVLLVNDPCGVLKATASSDAINNAGKGKFTVSVATYTAPTTTLGPAAPGLPPQPAVSSTITTPAPSAQASNTGTTPAINFTYNASATTNPGTIGPNDFTVSSTEAINIPGNIHVYQNYRDSVAPGTIVPVNINALPSEGLTDILMDSTRKLLYIANSGLNRIEVFDMTAKAFKTPIKVGQLPVSMAMTSDGGTLYVANAGGESISVVNLNKQTLSGSVVFPALPLNVSVSVSAPVAIAMSGRGPEFVMSDGTVNGTLWKVDGNQAIPRKLNPAIFGTTATTVSGGTSTTTAFWSLAATPAGEYVLLYTGTGNAYLYDYTIDDFTVNKTVLTTPLAGYRGPVTAGPQGRYYAVGGTFLNASLTPALGSTTGISPSGRPVAAVTAVSATQVALFTTPTRANATATVADPGQVELYDATTGASAGSTTALEGPYAQVIGNGTVSGFARAMAVDATTNTAYILTASGLSVVTVGPNATNASLKPSINPGGVVSLGDFTPAIAPGGLFTIFGKNLGASATGSSPLPTLLGGMCVTLNNTPIPLEMTSSGQINAQVPVTLAAGRYPMVLRSIANQTESSSSTVTVSAYAPAVLMAGTQATIVHPDGTYLTADNPGVRDKQVLIYATGLGKTTGAAVATGTNVPASPAANTAAVQVFFGNPNLKQSAMIVNSSVLVPGMIGVNLITVTIPGAHTRGNALQVTIRIGGVSSSVTGPDVPTVAVQ
jgi:uncharacterized protein (TIGR03437 family)